jgi:Asp-tRNA(Asn)/Glu-tRNA(Gln) amidotransferase A subunit family amidase
VARPPTVAELGTAYRSGTSDPVAAVEAALARIEVVDGVVGAFVDVLADEARAAATALAAELRAGTDRGPLHGVPIAVKAVVDVEGARVEAGSAVLAGRRPAVDAAVVARLRAAGAVVVGITRTHELAWGITTRDAGGGGTVNPHDPTRIAGGSSGGSAVAVATGVVPLAIGTDTAGSIRIPGACCGVWGLKPRWGLLSVEGVVPLAPSLDVVGFLAGDPGDLAVALGAATGDAIAAVGVSGRRVGVARGVGEVPLAPAVVAALDACTTRLGVVGAQPLDVTVPDGGAARSTLGRFQAPEALAVHRDVLRTWPAQADRYGADVAGRLRLAEAITAADHAAAREEAAALRAAWDRLLADVDAVVTPIASTACPTIADPDHVATPAGVVEWRAAAIGWTGAQNLCGLPAVAFPAGVDADGLPVGLQVTARTEATALAVAGAIAAPR